MIPIQDCLDLKKYEGHCTLSEELKEFVPRLTDPPPQELVTFRNESSYKRIELGEKFFSQDFIKTYIETKWSNELFNRSSFLRLFDLYNQEKENQSPTLELIIDLLNEFRRVILQTDHPFRALMLDFRKYAFPEKRYVPDVRTAVAINIFHGKVHWED